MCRESGRDIVRSCPFTHAGHNQGLSSVFSPLLEICLVSVQVKDGALGEDAADMKRLQHPHSLTVATEAGAQRSVPPPSAPGFTECMRDSHPVQSGSCWWVRRAVGAGHHLLTLDNDRRKPLGEKPGSALNAGGKSS
ncbi:unnamed protein product [Pleuronectes platessa]|uniref:Uncharacterized protein n=1 Tax=Pleuronectes platessa TaxID=8262 RepID=A0A9N7U568_PLEPL|nr:unnamed protein product [Pleuronectes platessa]